MQKGLTIRTIWLSLALVGILAFVLACGSAPEDGGATQAPSQPVATPTFPPTPIPPAIAAATAAPAAAPAAMTSDGIQMGGHLRVLNDGFPPKWDFTQTSTWISLFHYGGRAYSGLLQFSPRDGVEIWPDMAESWEVMDNNQTYVFHIDKDLTEYHDGQPFTLDDVVYAIDRWRNPPEGIIQPRDWGNKQAHHPAASGTKFLGALDRDACGEYRERNRHRGIAQLPGNWHRASYFVLGQPAHQGSQLLYRQSAPCVCARADDYNRGALLEYLRGRASGHARSSAAWG